MLGGVLGGIVVVVGGGDFVGLLWASTAGTAGFVFDRPWRFHSVWCREADTRGQGTSPVLDLAVVDLLGIDNSRLKSSLCCRHPS